ncbi:EAL domain-containing protein [Altererythrobacter sp. BO-6]|nr:EAL domain-containing protein [Altererythrobacter sp. BO-6]
MPLAGLLGAATVLTFNGQTIWPKLDDVSMVATVVLAAAIALYLARRGSIRMPLSAGDRASDTDMLSQLPSRRALHRDIDQFHVAGEEIAIALIDLDSFKQVNDHYGHLVGDQLIRDCAAIISEVCADEARCYRLSGDEFALSMRGPVAGNILEGICRQILERLAKPMIVGEDEIMVGASIGLSRDNGRERLGSSELLRRADVAMYSSKRAGKMRCTWFIEDLDRNREAQRELDTELRRALANEEFVLHYQPLVDAETRVIVAVESLIRWNRPDGQQIGPHIFIPVAEESGLINEIGVWVLCRACTDALAWGEIMLSVNISAAQLRNSDFPVQLGQILEETGFPPERLELEITETCLVLDPVVAERNLDVIRSFGVNISLDDFGTGYASIGFLRQFRFEKLKLDRSLVVDAGKDEGSRAMMLSSITVARALKMDVAAEGVETQEQADMVRIAGCDQIQGWLYFKAMPAVQVAQHLQIAAESQPVQQIHKGAA